MEPSVGTPSVAAESSTSWRPASTSGVTAGAGVALTTDRSPRTVYSSVYTLLVRPWWRTAYRSVIAPSSAGNVTVAAGSSVVDVYDVAVALVSGSEPSVV